jgi:hypothetical protein
MNSKWLEVPPDLTSKLSRPDISGVESLSRLPLTLMIIRTESVSRVSDRSNVKLTEISAQDKGGVRRIVIAITALNNNPFNLRLTLPVESQHVTSLYRRQHPTSGL